MAVHIYKNIKQALFGFSLIATVLVFSSCDNSTIYNESEILVDAKWAETDTLFAQFEVNDSTRYHDVWLCSRVDALYPYSNIYYKVILSGPNGQHMTEIKSFEITDKTGKWLGKGFGDLHSYTFPLFKDLSLKHYGKYRVKVVPYMRKDVIIGIHDRGIKVSLGKEIF